jgi:hypothetical protein
MPKLPAIVADYIAAQPEADQPALREIHTMFAQVYPQAQIELYGTAKGALPIYKQGDTMVGGFSLRAKGAMVYLTDPEVVAKYKPQLGSLVAPGNAACVLYKPTKTLDAVELKAVFRAMVDEVAAKRK